MSRGAAASLSSARSSWGGGWRQAADAGVGPGGRLLGGESGPIVIAVNPYEWIDDLYSPTTANRYLRSKVGQLSLSRCGDVAGWLKAHAACAAVVCVRRSSPGTSCPPTSTPRP